MIKIISILLLFAFVSTPAIADNSNTAYIAGDFGHATLKNLPGWSNPNVLRITGGYHFNRFFSVEIGLSTFGDSNTIDPHYGPAGISASSYQFCAIGSVPIGKTFDLIGKLGFANNFEEYGDASGGYGRWSEEDFLIGFGAQFNVNSSVTIRLTYDDYGKFDRFYPPMKATSLSLGIAYNFR